MQSKYSASKGLLTLSVKDIVLGITLFSSKSNLRCFLTTVLRATIPLLFYFKMEACCILETSLGGCWVNNFFFETGLFFVLFILEESPRAFCI
jgi:hypothetical protein